MKPPRELRDFDLALLVGNEGEKLVASFLKSRGAGIIPSYDFTGSDGSKAPRLMFEKRGLVIPDLDVCKEGVERIWIEVKTYHGPALNVRHNRSVHGITGRLFSDYQRVERESGTKVAIAVLEYESGALLYARQSSLTLLTCDCKRCAGAKPALYSCQCPPCSSGQPGQCFAPIRSGVYWPRSSMSIWHTFNEHDLRPIRDAVNVRHGGKRF
jgi:hypothetical protein